MTFTTLAFLEILPIHTGWVMVDEFCSRFVYFYAGYAFAPAIFRAADWLRQRPLIGIVGLLVWGFIEYKLVFMPVPESLAALITPAGDLLDGRGAVSDLPVVSLLLGLVGALAIISISSLLSLLPARNWLHRGLSWLGAHSIVVYLAFFLPMAIARTVLLKLGIGDIGTISLLTTASGVIGPVMLYGLIQWSGYGQFLFRRPTWAYIDQVPQRKRRLPPPFNFEFGYLRSAMGEDIVFRPAHQIKPERVGRNLKQASACLARPSRSSRCSSTAFRRCR